MSHLGGIIKGIQTAQQFYDKPDGYHSGAEHDLFYLYPTDRPMSDEAVAIMRQQGWFQEGQKDATNPSYNPEDGWAVYT